jgi:hypothetical protein
MGGDMLRPAQVLSLRHTWPAWKEKPPFFAAHTQT